MEYKTKFKGKANKSRLGYILISLALISIFLGIGKMKVGYNVDEIFTFLLSNHQYDTTNSIFVQPKDGVSYTGAEIWNEYLAVDRNHRFDYANVWKNQEADVHPPLYYTLIHTASSLFPCMSVKKIGIMIQAPLAIIVFWQLVWIMRRLQLEKKMVLILALAYILSAGFLDNCIVFFRMYTLLTVWMNFLIMLFLKYLPGEKIKPSYFVSLGIILLGGTLTQYYFLIFAFFTCIVYAVYVVLEKNWKKLIGSIITGACSAGLALLIFPGMWNHIFKSSRGTEAFENVTTVGFFGNLWKYLELINLNIFGGLFILLMAVLLCLGIILTTKQKEKISIYPYVLLILPVCFYVLVIAKIAPYQTLRYCISTMGLLYAGIFGVLCVVVRHISKTADIYILFLAVVMLFASYRQDLSCLDLAEKDKVAKIWENKSLRCIYLYDQNWKINPNMLEMFDLQDVMFININKWEEEKDNICQNESLLVFVDSECTDMLESLKEYTGMTREENLFASGYATVYVLQ